MVMDTWFGFYWTEAGSKVDFGLQDEAIIGSFTILSFSSKSANLPINRWIPSAIRMLLVPAVHRLNWPVGMKFEKTSRSGFSGCVWAVLLKA